MQSRSRRRPRVRREDPAARLSEDLENSPEVRGGGALSASPSPSQTHARLGPVLASIADKRSAGRGLAASPRFMRATFATAVAVRFEPRPSRSASTAGRGSPGDVGRRDAALQFPAASMVSLVTRRAPHAATPIRRLEDIGVVALPGIASPINDGVGQPLAWVARPRVRLLGVHWSSPWGSTRTMGRSLLGAMASTTGRETPGAAGHADEPWA